MNSYTIIEIAVVNRIAANLRRIGYNISDGNHYWRTRWIEDGEQADEIMQIDDLAGMARDVRRYIRTGETVIWRYYETGI